MCFFVAQKYVGNYLKPHRLSFPTAFYVSQSEPKTENYSRNMRSILIVWSISYAVFLFVCLF